jgi:6-pyruvoyltetrahydropterin/6-carboxytetrahydropterin synthase|tara:strand:+ start:429 stop:851 length:423 start_codon:yes stop_codon:yes gene_type:complete
MQVTKRLGGYSCCHRQWKDDGHCRWLHGYDRFVEITWEGERDLRGWVVDFGGLADLKARLDHQFDHTMLVAEDDPWLVTFEELASNDVVSLRIMDPTMEGMAVWVAAEASMWAAMHAPAARVVRVSCWENEKNAAVWTDT